MNKSRKVVLQEYVKEFGDKFEFFDERFYGVLVPKSTKVAPAFPPNFIDENYNETEKKLYAPSVTTIQGLEEKGFGRWRGDVGNDRADRVMYIARERGSELHNIINEYVRGATILFQNPKRPIFSKREITAWQKKTRKPVVVVSDQVVMVSMAKAANLLNQVSPIVMDSEFPIFSFDECYAGTADALWFIPKTVVLSNSVVLEWGLYVVDWKSGKGFDVIDNFRQLTAYAKALEKQLGSKLWKDFKGVLSIHVNGHDRNVTNYGLKVLTANTDDFEDYYQQFLALKGLWFARNQDTTFPVNMRIPNVLVYEPPKTERSKKK